MTTWSMTMTTPTFKVGDRVRRIGKDYHTVRVGDTGTVSDIRQDAGTSRWNSPITWTYPPSSASAVRQSIQLEEHDTWWFSAEHFELIDDAADTTDTTLRMGDHVTVLEGGILGPGVVVAGYTGARLVIGCDAGLCLRADSDGRLAIAVSKDDGGWMRAYVDHVVPTPTPTPPAPPTPPTPPPPDPLDGLDLATVNVAVSAHVTDLDPCHKGFADAVRALIQLGLCAIHCGVEEEVLEAIGGRTPELDSVLQSVNEWTPAMEDRYIAMIKAINVDPID